MLNKRLSTEENIFCLFLRLELPKLSLNELTSESKHRVYPSLPSYYPLFLNRGDR